MSQNQQREQLGSRIGFLLLAAGCAIGLVRSFYQTLTLKAYVYRGLFLNVGYQLYDFKTPSNLMLGAGITLR